MEREVCKGRDNKGFCLSDYLIYMEGEKSEVFQEDQEGSISNCSFNSQRYGGLSTGED